MKYIWLLFSLLVAFAHAQDEVCGSFPGVCTMDELALREVSFFDIDDELGCQLKCEGLDTCGFYTSYPDPNDVTLSKCMIFGTCNVVEECAECTTNTVDPNSCYSTGETCDVDTSNIHEILYFSSEDTFSCGLKCEDISVCVHWTQFEVDDCGSASNKCFIFRDCPVRQQCVGCISGEPAR